MPASRPVLTPQQKYAIALARWQAQTRTIIAHNNALANQWSRCIDQATLTTCGQYLTRTPSLPGQPTKPTPGQASTPSPALPPIPPEIIAYQAVAELVLDAPRPVIGPPPEINPWKTAAVGYPLWLSIDGDTTPAPVSDTVYDVSVTLQARLDRVVFDMGDGHQVTCTHPDHPWARSIEPGAPSPWCGYRYPAAPTHSSTYHVTAHTVWSIHWATSNAQGVLPFHQTASTDLPVAELQVLVR